MSKTIKNNSIVNCLRNDKIIVRFVPKKTDNIQDKKHIAYGGMMEGAVRTFTVPMLSSGNYKNVLTDNEKACLEEILGLEDNGLSIYNKVNNFWDNYQVRLNKFDTILDLSKPEDYIKYKVLLANKNYVAASLSVLRDSPRATYQYVLLETGEEVASSKSRVSNMMKCYEEFGKIKEDFDTLKTIIEIAENKVVSANTKIEFLQGKINDLILEDNKKFLQIIEDPYLKSKVLIKKAVEKGVIAKRGDFYYYKETNQPLCNNNEDPTFSIASKYLSAPQNQELKFAIEANLN
jgi:hypothetical protein